MIHHESDTLPIEGMYHILTELFPSKAITNPEPNVFQVECPTHTHAVTFTGVMEGFTIMAIEEAELKQPSTKDLTDLLEGLIDLLRSV